MPPRPVSLVHGCSCSRPLTLLLSGQLHFLPLPFIPILPLVFLVFGCLIQKCGGCVWLFFITPLLIPRLININISGIGSHYQCPSSGPHTLIISHLIYCWNFRTHTLTPVFSTFDPLHRVNFLKHRHIHTHSCSKFFYCCRVKPASWPWHSRLFFALPISPMTAWCPWWLSSWFSRDVLCHLPHQWFAHSNLFCLRCSSPTLSTWIIVPYPLDRSLLRQYLLPSHILSTDRSLCYLLLRFLRCLNHGRSRWSGWGTDWVAGWFVQLTWGPGEGHFLPGSFSILFLMSLHSLFCFLSFPIFLPLSPFSYMSVLFS